MKVKEFFDTEFKDFSNLDNVRSIPSVIDGFKDSQRKAVYGMLQNGQSEIKVAQAAGKFSLLTHYAHGENSMGDTIVGLAQDYPGSNNINLFEPIGQFGSILSSDASSQRYIFTKPSENLRKYIRKEDDCILQHRFEDGDKVEPYHFYPILPMWLVNGSVGIGTGHSVKILPRDPNNVRQMIQKLLEGRNVQERTIKQLMTPTFLGWSGEVVQVEEGKFEIHGVIEVVNTTTLRVTELPVGYGVDKFKAILVDLMDKNKIKDYDNNSTEEAFEFEIKVPRETARLETSELKKLFKLISRQGENVTMWDGEDSLKKYENVFEALREFVDVRLEAYEERRVTQIKILQDENDFLENKKLFILEWNNLANPGKMKTADIEDHMQRKGVNPEYIQRLMSLRISSLTSELIKELEDAIKQKKSEIRSLESTTATDMYKAEL